MKKLLIDVNSIVPYYVSGKLNGIGRTTLELITALGEIKDDLPFEVTLFSQNMKGIGGRNAGLPFKNRHLYLPHRPQFDILSAKLGLREMVYNYDIMHIPHNFEYVKNPAKCVITIHDAMFFSYPEAFLGHDFARSHYPDLAKKAKAIITCSENSKKEIVEYMQIEEDKIFVCPWGVNHALFRPQNVVENRFTGTKPYFIAVSCDIGRKNTISVLRAYRQFVKKSADQDLILVWRTPPKEILAEFEDLIENGHIHFASNISEKELSELYSMATASFFPSKYEGFGLPILESMACGTPVVTCRNSSLPEVGGDAAIYVEPDDIETMAGIMMQFEGQTIDLEDLKAKSIGQASQFTWERCVAQTVNVYKRCLDL